MRECLYFTIVMLLLITGMAIGQLGIQNTHQWELDNEWARHDAEEQRVQLAYKLKCEERIVNVLMQIDLTDSSDANLAFQERFSVLGLPTIMFFDAQGQELETARVTGFMRAAPFAEHVNSLFAK